MLCIMHDGEPYGHLTIGGKSASMRQIGILTGIGEKEATKLTNELENAGVFSRTDNGVIFSRRMVRDQERSEEGRVNVSKRWANTPPNRGPTTNGHRDHHTLEAESEYKKQEAERESSARKRSHPPAPKSKIPPDWLPEPEDIAFANEAGITDLSGNIDKFVNYNRANGYEKADWPAMWRVWCSREPEFRKGAK